MKSLRFIALLTCTLGARHAGVDAAGRSGVAGETNGDVPADGRVRVRLTVVRVRG